MTKRGRPKGTKNGQHKKDNLEKDEFLVSEGNMMVLRTFPLMMANDKFRQRLRDLTLLFIGGIN